jgi:hypothetical protein
LYGETVVRQLEVALLLQHLGVAALHPQVHRAGRAGDRGLERMRHRVFEAIDFVDREIRLRHAIEHGEVFHVLVHVAVARRGVGATRDGNDRRVRHVGVAQARRDARA